MNESRSLTEGRIGLQAHIQLFGFVILSFNSRKTSVFRNQRRFQIGLIEWHEDYYREGQERNNYGQIYVRKLNGNLRWHWCIPTWKSYQRTKEWRKNNPDWNKPRDDDVLKEWGLK